MVEIEELEREYASVRDKVADLRSYLLRSHTPRAISRH
jgi:hypothetical protein